jgi:hypothetical protein
MKISGFLAGAVLGALFLAACGGRASPAPQMATVTVTFNLGTGGPGFAASIYAQEVTTGKVFKGFYPAGSHGGVVLPTSPPISLQVEAPGTYVFYATLIEAPDDYQYGATDCKAGADCSSSTLTAIDVAPDGSYQVHISDRIHLVPTPGAPVTIPNCYF